METTNDSENGTEQGNKTQTNQKLQSKDQPITNFLEFGLQEHGKHSIAIIKNPGEERGTLAATIYANYSGEPRRASYSAKNRSGEIIMTSPKLYEIKKHIKENAVLLLAQAHQYKNIPEQEAPKKEKDESILKKEAVAVTDKVLDESKQFCNATKDVVLGTRNSQIKSIRHKRMQKDKDKQLGR